MSNLPRAVGSPVGFKISGELPAGDYQVLLPKLDEAIAAQGLISMLVLIEGFDGWAGLDAAKADFQLGARQYRQVERCAFVSDKKWHTWAVKLLEPFTTRTREKHFEPSQLDEAWVWACEAA